MDVSRHFALAIAALTAAASPPPATAQCRLCDEPTTAVPDQAPTGDVDLQIETNLNFDRLILTDGGTGAATIRPNGSNSAEGSVLEVGPRAMVGTVLVHGEPNRPVRVEVPRRVELFSLSGGRITLDDVTTDAPASPRLDAAGNLSIRFGGRLIISGESDGPYRGDLPITVEYE